MNNVQKVQTVQNVFRILRRLERLARLEVLAGCRKTLSESFDGAQDERRGFDIIEAFPFMLRLSKHSEPFFSDLPEHETRDPRPETVHLTLDHAHRPETRHPL